MDIVSCSKTRDGARDSFLLTRMPHELFVQGKGWAPNHTNEHDGESNYSSSLKFRGIGH